MWPEITLLRHRLLFMLGCFLLGSALVLLYIIWVDRLSVPEIVISPDVNNSLAVDVRGAVSTPGVVELDPGARVIDVIQASGGTTEAADLSLVNLSTYVRDGQMIVIPTRAAQAPHDATTLININTASVDELTQLPGIGDVYANRIVAYRMNNGPFASVDDLELVDGISPSLIDSIRPLVTVGDDG